MGTREKQNILTILIIIAILAIALIIGLVIYPDIAEENQTNNNQTESTSKVEEKTSSTTQETTSATIEATDTTEEDDNTYIGEEEKESNEEDLSKTKEERAIELAKQQWGEDDESVTYSIEQKDGNIYYVAVRLDTEVQQWYEVDTENWTITEY